MIKRKQTLDELLDDPMIQLVMARDGWHGDDVRMLLERARPTGDNADVPAPHVIAEVCRQHRMCF